MLSHILAGPCRSGSALRLGHCNGHMARTGLSLLTRQLECQGFFSGPDNGIAIRMTFGDSGVTESLGVG